ncbi:MAG TPA: YdcF family protein [Ignavibacteriaceae bacterium]|nr:YdcF family protein [Ignavibacteriaceae bacterium]
MNKKNKIIVSLLVIVILHIKLVFLIYIKYTNQQLALSDFNFLNIGNIFSFCTFLIIIIGIIVQSLQKKSSITITNILLFTTLLIFLIAAAYYSTKIQLPFSNIYFLGQNGNKLFIGLLFALYLFFSFTFASYVWFGILQNRSFILLRSIMSSIIISFIFVLFSFYYVSASDPKIDDETFKKDENNLAVVLGAAVWSVNQPSPTLASRVDKALQLFDSSLVGRIQLTGSNAPGELSEAEVAFRYAVSRNADSSIFLIEKTTTTTNEQIQFIRQNLLPKETINKIIIVSDKYHLVRIEEISKFNNLSIYAVPSDLKLSFESDMYYRFRESIGLLFFWFFAI